ncbi:hypothetical protein TNCV_674521 [Trichonephila clavipes]|nr:hypothetical protein TNCV_674521 [Trichonephila clavipes]
MGFKSNRFEIVEGLKIKVTSEREKIPEDFNHCFEQCQEWWSNVTLINTNSLTCCGRGSLVMKVTDSCPASYVLESRAAEDPPVIGKVHVKSVDVQTPTRWCSVEVRKEGSRSGIVLIPCSWSRMTRSIDNCPRFAVNCDVNKHLFIHPR